MNHLATPAAATSAEGAPRPDGPSSGIRRCLIVDDDAGIRRLIAYNLAKLGVATAECATVAAVEPALAEAEPDLIFLDLGLDKGDETSVLAILAERGYAGQVQIVSGRAQAALEDVSAWGRSRGLTMLPPFPKPFRSSAIKALVEARS